MKNVRINFISSSLIYILDNLTLSLGGYIFWLIVPKFTSAADIGYASSIVSMVTLLSSFALLGLEYSILKQASSDRKRIFGTLLSFEVMIHLALVPVVSFFMIFSIGLTSLDLVTVSIGFLILSGTAFVSRYLLLGVLEIGTVLICDVASIAVRYGVFFVFLFWGQAGIVPIITSYLAQQAVLGLILTIIMIKKIGILIDFKDRQFIKSILLDGVINFSSKFSRIMIASLSIVLLSLLGFSPSDIGTFYIPLLIGLAIGGFAANIATVALPTSTILNKDYTYHSMRLSLLLVVPAITIMLVISDEFLALIDQTYIAASSELRILSIASFPFAIVVNAITFLNHNKRMKDLVKLGILEIGLFLGTMFPLAEILGIVGVSVSILIAFSGSMIVSLYWLGGTSAKYCAIGLLSVGCGYAISYIASGVLPNTFILSIICATISMIVLFATRITSFSEIKSTMGRQ